VFHQHFAPVGYIFETITVVKYMFHKTRRNGEYSKPNLGLPLNLFPLFSLFAEQFQWLGLLKWSLQYQDGTKDSEWDELSEEKKAFLEKVMSEGVVDENVRMKQILVQFLRFLQSKTSGSAPILDAIAQLEAKVRGAKDGWSEATAKEICDICLSKRVGSSRRSAHSPT